MTYTNPVRFAFIKFILLKFNLIYKNQIAFLVKLRFNDLLILVLSLVLVLSNLLEVGKSVVEKWFSAAAVK